MDLPPVEWKWLKNLEQKFVKEINPIDMNSFHLLKIVDVVLK